MKDNPFARRENWGQWLVAVLVALVVAALLIALLTKLGGQSHRPDVERAMQPPPREAAPTSDDRGDTAATEAAASGRASGTITR